MNRRHIWVGTLALILPSIATAAEAAGDKETPVEAARVAISPITLTVGDLTAAFADNEAFPPVHKQRYNGIAALSHSKVPDNLFVPEYAGFNLEHHFGGDFLQELFEPRVHPMTLERLDASTVRLHQPPTPLSHVETTHVFRMAPPHFIDVTVTQAYHDLSFFKHGYAASFWASYINAPESKATHFWGITPEQPEPHWVESYSESHGSKSSHVFLKETAELFFAPDFNTTLASNFSGNKFVEPFYFGLRKGMVYAIFFDRTEGIRFSQSPTGGGASNPAWDHYFYVLNPEIGKPYGYRARVLYKPFVSNEDIRAEFQAWRKSLGATSHP
ncbi:MAG: hypothetical protein GHCLOJNM_01504 [bacterium]|nr:hypothetical protein [bacterium]